MTTFFENQKINIEDLPCPLDETFNNIEKNYKKFQHLRNTLVLFFLTAIVISINIFGEVNTDFRFAFFAAFILLAFFLIYSIFIVEIGYQRKAYLLRKHDLIYKSGYIFRKITAIPKNRIQHVEIRQGALLRLFNISRLAIYTAGGNGSDLIIPGLKPKVAASLKEHLSLNICSHE